MKKAVISVFVVLTLVLNIFGFGFLETHSYAVAVLDDILIGLLGNAIVGILSSWAAGLSGDVASAVPSAVLNWANSNAIQNGDVIQVNERLDQNGNHAYYYFSPVSGLSSDESECANFICDYLNSSEITETAGIGFQEVNTGMGGLTASQYAALKTEAVNAFTAYIEARENQIDMSNFTDALLALETATGQEWDPEYMFNFTGPLTPIQFAGTETRVHLDLGDATFFPPAYIDVVYSNGGFSRNTCELAGLTTLFQPGYGEGWVGGWGPGTFYGGGYYILYNNDIYFYIIYPHLNYLRYDNMYGYPITDNSLPNIVNCNNRTIQNDGITSMYDLVGLYFGYFLYNEPGTNLIPGLNTNDTITNASFSETTGGGSIDMPRTDDEDTIGLAMTLGIIPDNAELELDENGNIIGADGLSLETIESMIQQLLDRTYEFSDFESYLQLITQLLQAGNVNTDKIDDIISRLRTWEQSQSNALSTINTNVAAIADALTQTYEDDDDIETQDTYIVEHAGLTEANALVNTAMPFVGQMRTLINNLFDPNNFNNTPPNFHFYADFDNDGVNERYNALDLSFLETSLTNENLEDKGRYTQPVTVRELLQDILVLIVYSFFAFSMLKRIPSLINGSSSDEKNVINIRGD